MIYIFFCTFFTLRTIFSIFFCFFFDRKSRFKSESSTRTSIRYVRTRIRTFVFFYIYGCKLIPTLPYPHSYIYLVVKYFEIKIWLLLYLGIHGSTISSISSINQSSVSVQSSIRHSGMYACIYVHFYFPCLWL